MPAGDKLGALLLAATCRLLHWSLHTIGPSLLLSTLRLSLCISTVVAVVWLS